MKPLILLDFDGVLFNSAYEAYQVCEHLAKGDDRYRHGLSFDEFMSFRAQLTDAWQFCRLYQKDRILRDITKLHEVEPDADDWRFSEGFFAARAEMIKDPDWAKLMSPYPFFYQLRPLLMKYPQTFKILSTRNKASIQRTLEFFEADGIEIYGQEEIREHGSKLGVAKHKRWLENGDYVVYIDDMNSHLEPFETEVDLCIHAGWGYDVAHVDSYTQGQAFQIIGGFLKLAHE
ncbi:hypothetical protein [Roseateles chitosanitabidus]|uniref:hypothetical protein n=1 Tax=Roseateles chitosanitabidus TaxID=65048 RepID=UPI00082E7419|nr:hypothetical protein [Roseateles chitosanitabidus]